MNRAAVISSNPRPAVGAERYLLEVITNEAVEALARKAGWDGSDNPREFCEPDDAALYVEFATLDQAAAAARTHLATGTAFYGCAIIDHQIFEAPRIAGEAIGGVPPCWERQKSWEIARDGELLEVDR